MDHWTMVTRYTGRRLCVTAVLVVAGNVMASTGVKELQTSSPEIR